MLRRMYDVAVENHVKEFGQMLFLSGARRVGKTTCSLSLKDQQEVYYFNWDDEADRLVIQSGARAILHAVDIEKGRTSKPVVVFDELHKMRRWKGFLKGFYDKYHYQVEIVVTGSARLDVYQRGGDSLMGRYFLYRVHPLSVRELIDPSLPQELVRAPLEIAAPEWEALWKFGGFPEPYLRRSPTFSTRWGQLRRRQLFQEDLRDLTRVHEIAQMELLAEWLRRYVGSGTSYSELAKRTRVSVDTIRRWTAILESLYYVFAIRPWSGNIPRSLTKEPKYYLWDWSAVEDPAARLENLVASHLLKATHFWTDHGLGEFGLYYLRDRDGREVDFLVVRDGQPWLLVEVKTGNSRAITPHLYHFHRLTKAAHALQVVGELPYSSVNCFAQERPAIVPAKTFLSQLV